MTTMMVSSFQKYNNGVAGEAKVELYEGKTSDEWDWGRTYYERSYIASFLGSSRTIMLSSDYVSSYIRKNSPLQDEVAAAVLHWMDEEKNLYQVSFL